MNGGGRQEEDWGFYPDLARQPGKTRGQGRRGIGGKGRAGSGSAGQQYPGGRGRSGLQGTYGDGSGRTPRSRTKAVVVLFVAALVILITGIAIDQANISGPDDAIDWELLPLPQETVTSLTE